jgi:ABC-2 type transport system permease protein
MPEMMQWYTYLFPARYFVEISRGIIMKGTGPASWWPQLAALALYTGVVFGAAAAAFRKKVA